MAKKSAKPDGSVKDGIEVEIGGLFSTLGNTVDLLGRLAEAGAKHVQPRDDLTVEPLGDEAHGAYGISIRTGRGGAGADNVEPFRNIHAATEGVGGFVDSDTWLAHPGTVGRRGRRARAAGRCVRRGYRNRGHRRAAGRPRG